MVSGSTPWMGVPPNLAKGGWVTSRGHAPDGELAARRVPAAPSLMRPPWTVRAVTRPQVRSAIATFITDLVQHKVCCVVTQQPSGCSGEITQAL